MTTNLRNARRIEQREDDRCAWPACRLGGDAARYSVGSSELTKNFDACFCDKHLEAFGRALDELRDGEAPSLSVTRPLATLFAIVVVAMLSACIPLDHMSDADWDREVERARYGYDDKGRWMDRQREVE